MLTQTPPGMEFRFEDGNRALLLTESKRGRSFMTHDAQRPEGNIKESDSRPASLSREALSQQSFSEAVKASGKSGPGRAGKEIRSGAGSTDKGHLPELIINIGKPATIAPGPDGKIDITQRDFDKIGSKAKQVLLDAGVTRLTVTPGHGFDTYQASLKRPLEIAQDPDLDGTRKLRIDTNFKADVRKEPDGSILLQNIEGLTAESKIMMRFREAQVEKIQLKATADGKTEVTSTGTWNGFSGTKTRIQEGGAFDKANNLLARLQKVKG
jgi:hypothetical protein